MRYLIMSVIWIGGIAVSIAAIKGHDFAQDMTLLFLIVSLLAFFVAAMEFLMRRIHREKGSK